jgi:hypothetical protein
MKLAMESPPQRASKSVWAGTGSIRIEAEEANWSVGLYVVNLVDAAVKPELDLVLAVYLVQVADKLSCVLAQTVIAIGICADIRISSRVYWSIKIAGTPLEPIGLQIGRKS